MDHGDGASKIQAVSGRCCTAGCHVRIIGHSKGGGLSIMALHSLLNPTHGNLNPFAEKILSIAV